MAMRLCGDCEAGGDDISALLTSQDSGEILPNQVSQERNSSREEKVEFTCKERHYIRCDPVT
jgi:hypothetical protein